MKTDQKQKTAIDLIMPVGAILLISALGVWIRVYAETSEEWILVDYSFRTVELALIAFIPYLRECVKGSFGAMKQNYEPFPLFLLRIGSAIVLAIFLMELSEYWIRQPLQEVIPNTRLDFYPVFDDAVLYWVDMTFGLALVAVSEEFIFRSVLKEFIGRFTNNVIVIVIISSIIFGMIHWAHGMPNVVDNIFVGVIFMGLYIKTRSIIPPIIAHYLTNVWYFV
ncbi:MAG: CPBP family intramembrane metalloprotease [Rhodospirillaceae bacterium]|nr:CPBP family intramembrane metalloprotease [Rhodospirillaceae bacterium]